MKEIQLTQGKVALVDDEDFEYLNQWKWYTHKEGGQFYAVRNSYIGASRTMIYMHWIVMGRKLIDHIDHCGTNNQRLNLRACNKSENSMNRRSKPNTSSIYKGVTWHKYAKKWKAAIKINGKSIHLGLFDSEVDAGKAYDKSAKIHHGVFVCLNFPNEIDKI